MTGSVPLGFVQELHLHFALPRLLAQIVVAHHAVEIERPRGSCIDLNRGDFRHLADCLGDAVSHICGHRQRGSLRHIQHDGKLRLVVQRQHFDRNPLGVEHGASEEKTAPQDYSEEITLTWILDQRGQQFPIETFQPLCLPVFPLLRHLQIGHGGTQPFGYGKPGRKYKCGKQGYQHGRRTQCWYWLHVWPHHTAYKSHREQCGYDCESGKNCRISNLCNRFHRGHQVRLALFQPTPVDILHHHNGVIHQNSD